MAERARKPVGINLETVFDRLLSEKLEQSYGILVPEHARPAVAGPGLKGGAANEQAGGDLRTGVFGQATGESYDRQPDGGREGVRKYAYQVLLMEEFAKNGVETVFVRAPQAETPEERLLLQVQRMLSEYERAQILERSRRGKRHRAKQGEASVLSNAPYGFRYAKKIPERPGYYEIFEPEVAVVRKIYELYTGEGLAIGAITARLNAEGIPPRKSEKRWERSSVVRILKNPAYRGMACFGKTKNAPRQRKITRPVRLNGGRVSQRAATVRPREEWIEIPVPAIVTPEVFAMAEERLRQNKQFSLRRTKVERSGTFSKLPIFYEKIPVENNSVPP
ncbi:MAG: recombinase family protein [Nitrospirota bacterium]|nr:recombinase family protein [Nitrospirota bacterium]